MTEKSTTPLELATVKALGDRVKKSEGELKHRARDEMTVGDRRTAALPDGTKVGSISYVTGRRKATVVDDREFTRWVMANYPTEIVTTESVRDSFRKTVLDRAKDEQVAVDPATGEAIPGVEFTTGEPYVRADVKPEQAEAIALAWVAGELGVDPLREITGGEQ